MFLTPLHNQLVEWGLPEALLEYVDAGMALLSMALLAGLLYWPARWLVVPLVEKAIRRSAVAWDDFFIEHSFFPRLARLVPIVFVHWGAGIFLAPWELLVEPIRRLVGAVFIVVALSCLNSLLQVIQDIYTRREVAKERPISGYVSLARIIFAILAGILVLAMLLDKSPWGILSVLGGLTAVLLLIFKDTILGFVASMQLSAHRMIRVGDWIEMPEFGADGDVVEVTIHTVKVRNWDKTITTIPTYALVSKAFKNWRGMFESGGRRIKRCISLDMNSVGFCSKEMLERLAHFHLLKEYLAGKEAEIEAYNRQHDLECRDVPNGRRQTNLGVFRAYIKAYLANHPKIHQEMTFLVRHLAPTAKGLPMEIYVFSNDQAWANYEDIQADIMDHLLAVIPEFGLRVFQEPSGYDFQKMINMNKEF